MPTFTIGLPNGQEVDIDAPEGATESQALAYAKQQYESGALDRYYGVGESALGGLETIGAMGTGLLGQIGGGLTGLGTAAYEAAIGTPYESVISKAARTARETAEAMTYEPRTPAGRRIMSKIGEAVEPIAEPFSQAKDWLNKTVWEATGSPELGALASVAPEAALAFLGIRSMPKAGPVRLLDEAGAPTRELQDILRTRGLTYQALTPEAKALIPKEIKPSAAGPSLVRPVETTEIAAGGRQAALAERQLTPGGKITADPFGSEAIRQGWDEGFVQAVKTSSPQTKAGMKQMLDTMEQIAANKRVAGQMRPLDTAGEAIKKRIDLINSKKSQAAKDLDVIAKNQLSGVSMNQAPIQRLVSDKFDELGVTVKRYTTDGKPVLDFENSVILKDPASKRIMGDVIDLLWQKGPTDAARFHRLKKQLDNLIDYRISSGKGMTKEGQRFLKDLRFQLNSQLREVNPRYAEVNDILSKSLNALEDFQSSAGTKVDLFSDSAPKMIGQQARRLTSQTQARVLMEDAIKQLDDLAAEFGGKFGDSAYDLTMFANNLERRFGAVAETGFQGQIESAIEAATRGGVKQGVTEAAIGKTKEAIDRMRGVNDYGAFRAIDELLRRKY